MTNVCRIGERVARQIMRRSGKRIVVGVDIMNFAALLIAAALSLGTGPSAVAQSESGSQASNGNLARTADVTVSGELNGFPKSNAIDGSASTEWAGAGGHPWIVLMHKGVCFLTPDSRLWN